MNNYKITAGWVIGGIVIGVLMSFFLDFSSGSNTKAENEPLYWVAPMDPNYQRDAPGKSPMGMDLIPVYADSGTGKDSPGTIRIDPDVVNNLGVRTAKARIGTLDNTIETVGYVGYDEDKLIHIHPRVEGWIEKLYVETEGEQVTIGQPLYSIYSPTLVNAQEELIIALNRGNKPLIESAKSRLLALQIPQKHISDISKSRSVRQTITINAPQNGVVSNLAVRQGMFVKPGNALMSIGSLEDVWVIAEIFERQAGLLNENSKALMKLDYLPGREWPGSVDYVYPTLDSKTRTVPVRLRFENRDGLLKPNMFAQLSIKSNDEIKTLIIPKEAVIRTGTRNRVVLALGKGKFKSVSVKTGRINDEFIEILEGLSDKDNVVTSAQFLLDSESSKTSDFNRMSHTDDSAPSSVWVGAKINTFMKDHKMINATHEPVPEWDWPEMTMDFNISDSVDISAMQEGINLHIQISKLGESNYEISNIHIMNNTPNPKNTAEVTGIINRINMEKQILNISRGPIEKWKRPPATMDFLTTKGIDISELTEGDEVQFTLEIRGGEFFILAIEKSSVEKDKNEHEGH